jgi:hypothetical protein
MKSPLQIRLAMAISILVTTAALGLGTSHLWATDKSAEAPASQRPQLVPLPEAGPDASEPLYPTWWGDPPQASETTPCKDAGNCVKCHEANAAMDSKHAVACTKCHHGNAEAEGKDAAHVGLIKDPGDLKTVDRTCGACHTEEARRVKHSAMALTPRMINHTRFAFGGQKTPDPAYATMDVDGLQQVPHPANSANLGDDLLRRSCLRCHLYTKGSDRWGEHRGLGCSACHVAYPNNGDGKPRSHSLVRDPGITACLKCHNSNHVGADYVGLFEKDFDRGFRSPVMQGRQPTRIYGSEQHRLLSDVHFRAGMKCTDCHTLDEVHGTGEVSHSPYNGVKISCEGCHVRGDHPAIQRKGNGEMILLRGKGRRVPSRNAQSIPHRVAIHREKLKCSACHTSWSFQDYGFHLMLEEKADYWKWASTAAQNDPQIQSLLSREIGTYAELITPADGPIPPKSQDQWDLPVTEDWLTGEKRPGAWFRGYTERKWSRPPLGLDHRGKVSIIRPMYQYVISHVDADNNLLLDRHVPTTGSGHPALIVNPYSPHTIVAKGRMCHECHGNPKAAGLGEGLMGIEKPGFSSVWRPESQIPGHSFLWDALVDLKGNALQWSTHPSAGPLDAASLMRLLNPSGRHRAEWHRYLNYGR